ncbi:glycerate kinase family protein [Paenibacillus sp. 481]|uniref:glycerate kinase family protein n=1 Tax=Paenibacillus sp. 481 TaxID=2835869 RepID=UPI001E6434D3|nr:glycerate kinase [Paenibacillus sp. 481]UHA73806.1 glycerate kinase [Paenibacillus sp. 481]
MRILIVPSGFKESVDAEKAAHCMKSGIMRVMPEANIVELPMVDGGEGFTRTLVRMTKGQIHDVKVTGPVGQSVMSHFGFLGGDNERRTAIIEMAAAGGLRLVPRSMRDPRRTTTHGVGELIKAALDKGAERILIGCGDSGTSDGGAGMAQALGAKFYNKAGEEIVIRGAISLLELDRIDLSSIDPRIHNVQLDVAGNWFNKLCGENGVARIFGPQKGATPSQVQQLEAALEQYSAIIERDLGVQVRDIPVGGASGGLGAGLHALLGAKLHARYDIIMKYMDLDQLLNESDLVFTAEGCIDYQTPRGKIPAEVAKRAKRRGLPVIAVAGTVGEGARINYEYGIDAFSSISQMPASLEEAFQFTEQWLADCTESAMRTLLVGYKMAFRARLKEAVV